MKRFTNFFLARPFRAAAVFTLALGLHLNAPAYTVTTLADSGPGSLRDGLAGNDPFIDFSVTGTITLTSGELLVIDKGFNITGPGAGQLTISGNNASRIFHFAFTIGGGGPTLSGLTIANGFAAGGDGGGILVTGSEGPTRFEQLAVINNVADRDGGGVYYNGNGPLRVENCTFSANSAGHDGGGIYNSFEGPLEVQNSTISGNSAGGDGGGVNLHGDGPGNFQHVTITLNVADSDNDGNGNGGGISQFSGPIEPFDSIVAGNYDTPGNAGPGPRHPDISGGVFGGDYNLIQDTTGTSFVFGVPPHTIIGVPPGLASLANNGGPTSTHALLAGSPALDAGSGITGTDQRGYSSADSDCDGIDQRDIGAYEAPFNAFGINNPPPTIVSATADCHSGKIVVTFNGPVDLATVQTANNYSFVPTSLTLNNAAYGANKSTVVLDTINLVAATTYTLTVQTITALCGTTPGTDSIGVACPSEIRGRVFADVDNANGCVFTTGTDLPLANWNVQLNAGSLATTLTDANGEYYFIVAPGTYTIDEVVQANWAQTCPLSTYTVTIGAAQLVSLQNFANQATANVSDLAVDMVTIYPSPLTTPCCGQEMTYIISYENKGTVAVPNATLHLDLVQGVTYQSFTANPPLAAPSGIYTWTLPALLQPTERGLIYVKVMVNTCGGGTPLLIAKATIFPNDSGGGNQVDNDFTHSVQVACSYDPNDKQVSPKGCGADGMVPRDTLFTYLILFQNLGSGPAHRVVVRDPLDLSLDLSTVQVLSASHAYTFAITGQELVWTFDNIELPAAAVDEPGSHGFVHFRVRSSASAPAGTQIHNTAGIYFDLNQVVTTATTLNTLTDDPMPISSFTVASPSALTRDFHYTGGTPGATLQWDFGTDAVPPTATGPDATGVIFSTGVQRVILRISVGGCEAEPSVKVLTVGGNNRTQLHASRSGGNMIITWEGPGQLEAADEVSGPWGDVSNAASPYTAQMDGSARFFRLRLP
jgi:hypothetical protein